MIKLYKINKPHNIIGKIKNTQQVYTADVNLTRSTDQLQPTILLTHQQDLSTVNYAYIEAFKRYYFITEVIKIGRIGYKLIMRVDVLESFKLDILNSRNIDYLNSVNLVQTTLHSKNSPNYTPTTIITTIGGD